MTVKSIETGEVLNGGKILLTENVRDHWVLGQYEIVAVGAPTFCDDYTECERRHEPAPEGLRTEHYRDPRLVSGAWILAKPRTAIDSGTRDVFFLAIDDVIGIMA